ncbi:maker30 [Drosophila busckii]|uniref:Maker30 n=1 Tax=Drosophila busckii TaxID=30019 RepID=A0A0M4EFH2_DROBS|nr:maker30 [Drosophila busckii]
MLKLTGVLLLTDIAITRADVSGRIVNGYEAADGDIPYMVYLTAEDKYVTNSYKTCGGSIIGNTWVLTAGHCVCERTPVIISYGSTDRRTPQFKHIVSGDDIFLHPTYDKYSLIFDIALLRTPYVEFSSRVNKVKNRIRIFYIKARSSIL